MHYGYLDLYRLVRPPAGLQKVFRSCKETPTTDCAQLDYICRPVAVVRLCRRRELFRVGIVAGCDTIVFFFYSDHICNKCRQTKQGTLGLPQEEPLAR